MNYQELDKIMQNIQNKKYNVGDINNALIFIDDEFRKAGVYGLMRARERLVDVLQAMTLGKI